MDEEMMNKLVDIQLKHNPQTREGAAIVVCELLTAMREPSVIMLQDGHNAARKVKMSGVSGMTIEAQTNAQCARERAAWRAMISAIIGVD